MQSARRRIWPDERFRRRWLPTPKWAPYADFRADEHDLACHLRGLPTDPRQVTGQLRRLAGSGVAEVERDRGRRGTQLSGTYKTEGEPPVTRKPPGFQRPGRWPPVQKRGHPPRTAAVFPSWAGPLCLALIPLSGASGCYRAVVDAALHQRETRSSTSPGLTASSRALSPGAVGSAAGCPS